jgi:hypothetical protein
MRNSGKLADLPELRIACSGLPMLDKSWQCHEQQH